MSTSNGNKAAQRRRAHARRAIVPCPVPWKMLFNSLEDAERWLADRPTERLTVYDCRCGYWHLASQRTR